MPTNMEQRLRLPASQCPALVASLKSRVGVVVTHPWGLLGGNMFNNVVTAVVLYFQRLGISTLRFNFGGSQIGRGYSQVEQVVEAAKYLLQMENTSYILLVGYSYGSLIAGSASAKIPECVGSVSVAPPWSVKHWLLCFNSDFHLSQAKKRHDLRRLMVLGNKDNFTDEKSFMKGVETFPEETTTGAVLKGADHFFARREKDLLNIVGQWIVNTYPECQGNLSNFANSEIMTNPGGVGGDVVR